MATPPARRPDSGGGSSQAVPAGPAGAEYLPPATGRGIAAQAAALGMLTGLWVAVSPLFITLQHGGGNAGTADAIAGLVTAGAGAFAPPPGTWNRPCHATSASLAAGRTLLTNALPPRPSTYAALTIAPLRLVTRWFLTQRPAAAQTVCSGCRSGIVQRETAGGPPQETGAIVRADPKHANPARSTIWPLAARFLLTLLGSRNGGSIAVGGAWATWAEVRRLQPAAGGEHAGNGGSSQCRLVCAISG
jgi:hypothetical protein